MGRPEGHLSVKRWLHAGLTLLLASPCMAECSASALWPCASVNPYSPVCASGAAVVDQFFVEGPDAQGPLTFIALLHADIAITGSYRVKGDLSSPGGFASSFGMTQTGPVDILIPVVRNVGEWFTLTATLEADPGDSDLGGAVATATLRFSGLAAAYRIRSCQGYTLPTPVRPATWGALKADYR